MNYYRQRDELYIKDYNSICLPNRKIKMFPSLYNICNGTNISLKIKVFTDLQMKAELYEINWTLFLSRCAVGLGVNMAC